MKYLKYVFGCAFIIILFTATLFIQLHRNHCNPSSENVSTAAVASPAIDPPAIDVVAPEEEEILFGNTWTVSSKGICIRLKLYKPSEAGGSHQTYKTFHMFFSPEGTIQNLVSQEYSLSNTSIPSLLSSTGKYQLQNIKNINFDTQLGLLEIEFKAQSSCYHIETNPKLVVTRENLLKQKWPEQRNFKCSAILEYQTKFSEEALKELPKNEFVKNWLREEFTSTNNIVLPSCRLE